MLTTSKIRNLLSMISSLYDEVRRNTSEKLGREEVSRIQYIRLHFAYEAGRDNKVKEFVQEADIFAHLKDIGESKESFILFCRYMEALVAYHRYHGGKE
jgi:CRISPR-associated protein Csm2